MTAISVNAYRVIAMGELTAVGKTLTGAYACLIGADFVATPDLVAGDLTFITQTGLAVYGPVVWSVAYLNPLGQIAIATPSHAFICGSPLAAPITVYGFALVGTGLTPLYAVERFDQPIAINEPGDGFTLVIEIPYGF